MGNVIDLVGKRFGKLVVIERAGSSKQNNALWKCKCDCGNEKITSGTALRIGNVRSCGCIRSRDLTGEHFSRLTVIEWAGKNKSGRMLWKCICTCGKTVIVPTSDLKNGTTRSCGCLRSVVKDNLVGERFGRLTIIKRLAPGEKTKHGIWECKCDCGATCYATTTQLKNRIVVSCGCYAKELTVNRNKARNIFQSNGNEPGYARLYRIRNGMLRRCYNPKSAAYKNYGGRGISVCDEWRDHKTGLDAFREWAFNNGYNDSLSIDRINNDGNYEPENCRWTNRFVQAINRRDNNKNLMTGVSKCTKSDKYQARIRANGKPIYLGVYDTEEEAHEAYIAAKKIYHNIDKMQEEIQNDRA